MAHEHTLKPPKDFEVPSKFRAACIGAVIIGAIAFFVGMKTDPHGAWNGYLIGFWFTLSMALSGPFIVATQHLTKAGWSTSVRRVPLAFGAFVLPAFILALVGWAGGANLYEWYDQELVAADHVLHKKAAFLNQTSFAVAIVVSFVGWISTIYMMKKESLTQDADGKYEHTYALQKISAAFLLSFIVGFSLMSWYWIMGLQPHWFSTMFNVYCFAGLFQAGWALTIFVSLWLNDHGYFGDLYGEEQIHQLGKMLFAFTVFWAYIGFSQFLLIWYANIPEEAIWFVTRGTPPDIETGWDNISIILPVLKFIVPFFILLPQAIKKNKNNILRYVAAFIVVIQLFEVWFWVAPTPGHGGGYATAPHPPVIAFFVVVAFLGLFGYVVSRELSKAPIVPLKDPFLHEAVPHHNHGTRPPMPAEMKVS